MFLPKIYKNLHMSFAAMINNNNNNTNNNNNNFSINKAAGYILDNRGSILDNCRSFSSLHRVQTGFGDQPTSCAVDTMGCFRGTTAGA
jgi:hypothetical protein